MSIKALALVSLVICNANFPAALIIRGAEVQLPIQQDHQMFSNSEQWM